QIIRGEYVNLALLLKGGMELDDLCSSAVLRLSVEGNLESRPRECRDRITTIERWSDAFLIYMAIFITGHKDRVPELLQYMYNIRDCAQRQGGQAWARYDEQFRIRQAVSPMSWANINNELWWRCMQVRESQSATATATASQAVGKAYTCNDFNTGFCRWPMCKFAHVCSRCGLSHKVVNCPSPSGSMVPQGANLVPPAVGQSPFRSQFRGSPTFRRGRGRGRSARGFRGRFPY
ncbi:MAG: hypothetical protein ABW185_05025, partial [Sedimenticola sp.]